MKKIFSFMTVLMLLLPACSSDSGNKEGAPADTKPQAQTTQPQQPQQGQPPAGASGSRVNPPAGTKGQVQQMMPAIPQQTKPSTAAPVPVQAASSFRSVTPAEAKSLIDSRKDLLIVDVRERQELREGKIANSQLIPFWTVMRGQHNLPKDKTILLICAVGGRSYAAGQVLARQGYKEIINLSGGIGAWKKANFPLEPAE